MRILTSIALASIATCAFARGEPGPPGGTYYPEDAMNQGYITATFDERVAASAATVSVGAVAREAVVEPVGLDTRKAPKTAGIVDGPATETSLHHVYNVQGALVKANASKADMNNLPAGIYFVNGKKIVIY